MTTALKLRRGTTAQHASFTGAAGEVTVDTTKKTVVVHDGSTAGGTPLAKEATVTSGLAGKADAGINFGFKNRIINGNFNVNQRGVSGTVTLAAGAYGHDRFKAGASGCTYTFATSDNVTTLTISAGSLIQVIEGLNLETGTFCLSWVGTAQGKIGAGSYSASGVTGSITGGTNTNVEFNTGTLSKVQLEVGSSATPFDTRAYGTELALCQRYFENVSFGATGCARWVSQDWTGYVSFAVSKRANPTITLGGSFSVYGNSFSGAATSMSTWSGGAGSQINGFGIRVNGGVPDVASVILAQNTGTVFASAEL